MFAEMLNEITVKYLCNLFELFAEMIQTLLYSLQMLYIVIDCK